MLIFIVLKYNSSKCFSAFFINKCFKEEKFIMLEKTFLPIDDDDQETWFELPLNVLIWIYWTKKINLRLEQGVL